MKTLEEKIIKKMYTLEITKTALSIILKIVGVIFFGGIALFLTQILIEVFKEEKTFDVLEIFSDDIEVVRAYLFNILNVIFQETPKELLLIIIISTAICLAIFLTFVFNFGKMKHKLTAVWHYLHNKKYDNRNT